MIRRRMFCDRGWNNEPIRHALYRKKPGEVQQCQRCKTEVNDQNSVHLYPEAPPEAPNDNGVNALLICLTCAEPERLLWDMQVLTSTTDTQQDES